MDILLFGGGGHCKAVIDVIEAEGKWRIAGIVEAPGSPTREVLGYPVVGYDDGHADLLRLCPNALVTVGQIRSPAVRQRIFARLGEAGFTLPSIVSPLARVARSARLEAGSIVMHYALVGPDARVGLNTIVNTRALVEHDAVVGDHCHVATTAVLNGHVAVGHGTLIGSGAVCREGITIGANCLIAMGSRVRKPVADGTLFFGDKSR